MRRRQAQRPRQAGFTLIEMLVALTLIGLLAAGMFGGLRLGARAWETGGARIEASNDIVAGRRFLARRLADVQALTFRDPAQGRREVFRGEATRLRFAAPWPLHLGGGGPQVFELRRAEAGGGGLLLDWSLYRPEGPVPPSDDRERPRRLFGGARDVHFRYYGRQDDGGEARWSDVWDVDGRLPRVIEIRMAGGDLDAWPPLRVAVATAAEGF